MQLGGRAGSSKKAPQEAELAPTWAYWGGNRASKNGFVGTVDCGVQDLRGHIRTDGLPSLGATRLTVVRLHARRRRRQRQRVRSDVLRQGCDKKALAGMPGDHDAQRPRHE